MTIAGIASRSDPRHPQFSVPATVPVDHHHSLVGFGVEADNDLPEVLAPIRLDAEASVTTTLVTADEQRMAAQMAARNPRIPQ